MKILSSIIAAIVLLIPAAAFATDCHVNQVQAVVANYGHQYVAPVVQQFVTLPVYSALAVSDYAPVAYRNVVQKQVIVPQKVVVKQQRVVVRPQRVVRQRVVVKQQNVVQVQKVQKVVQVQKIQKVRAVHGHAIQQLNAGY